MKIRRVDAAVSLERVLDDCRALLRLVFPSWRPEDVALGLCSGGITNSLVRATHGGETVLVRIYGRGTEQIVDREAELANAVRLHAHGLGPAVHARFANGFVYGYVPGRVLDVDDVRQPAYCAAIARRLAELHAVPVNSCADQSDARNARPCQMRSGAACAPLALVRRWLSVLPGRYSRPEVDAQFRSCVDVGAVSRALDELSAALSAPGMPGAETVFCHNDLLAGNIVDTGAGVDFIDYEYAGPGFRGYDIGNHFCEWAGAECDYGRYPDGGTRARWIHVYAAAVTSLGGPRLDEERLARDAALGALLAHALWGVWGLLQAEASAIDFDYMTFAVRRLGRLLATKDAVLADWASFCALRLSCV